MDLPIESGSAWKKERQDMMERKMRIRYTVMRTAGYRNAPTCIYRNKMGHLSAVPTLTTVSICSMDTAAPFLCL